MKPRTGRRAARHRSVEPIKLAELLLDVSNKLGATPTLAEALRTLVQITVTTIGAERGSVFLHDPGPDELFSRILEGTFEREVRMPSALGIAGHVFTTGTPVTVDRAYGDPRFNRAVDEMTGFTTKSVLCVPLVTLKGTRIGIAQLLNKIDGVFTESDLELLSAMVEQAAVAIEHHRTVEAIEKTRAQQLELLGVVSEISSELQLGPLLAKLIGTITKLLDAERSTLFINDEKRGELYTELGEGLGTTQIRFPNDRGIAGAVFQSLETINIPHAYADQRFNPSVDRQTGFFTRSILCVPVINKQGKAIGVTQVLNKRGGLFTGEDEARLRAFTSQISIGLENAKLFDDVQNIKNYNASILESMTNGVITLNEEETIVTCNAAGLRMMNRGAEALVDRAAEEVFTGPNTWVIELVRKVEDTLRGLADRPMRRRSDRQAPQETAVDASLTFGDETFSVNLTVLPLIGIAGNKLGSMIMIEDISTEKRIKSTMARYMDPSLADRVLEAGQDILGGHSGDATILFSDIAGFTALTEELGAAETVSLLNEYFTLMVDCVQHEGGMLDKFVGDAVMAVFGIPLAHDDDADRAVRTAIAMIRALEAYNSRRRAERRHGIDIRIGVNTDVIVSGNIGSPKRMDYTVIGDGVNLASRLEGACKAYGAHILVSEGTFGRLRGTYRSREIDRIVVKGKSQPVAVHEILEYHSRESFPNIVEALGTFKDGLACYRAQRWDDAVRAFGEVLRLNPADTASAVYAERCRRLQANPPGDDWTGVWVMESK
jgi:adenylate cyclase